jgi:hypothetical protein
MAPRGRKRICHFPKWRGSPNHRCLTWGKGGLAGMGKNLPKGHSGGFHSAAAGFRYGSRLS